MRILVVDIIGKYALAADDGQMLYDIIHPHLKNGIQVILDFKDVDVYACAFMNMGIGQLYKDLDPKGLLSVENMPSHGKHVVRAVVENAKRYYSMTEEERRARDLAFFAALEES